MAKYETPQVMTLEARRILELIGPAQGSSSGVLQMVPYADSQRSDQSPGTRR